MTYHILVVDNDPLQCRTAQLTIEKMLMYKVTTLTGGKSAIDLLLSEEGRKIDLLLLDLAMPGTGGLEVLNAIRPARPDLPIIIYTAHGDVEVAVQALRQGAVDFVEKKDGPERLQVSIDNVLRMKKLEGEVERLRRAKEGQVLFSDIIGTSQAVAEAKKLADRAAKSGIPVLIRGASGVGKELFARAIHGASDRAGGAFVAVNCGAIPENLVESVLFGHEKGAFTGAVEKTIGKFREAGGGTLFLDEIGELKADIQVKLLRALQESEIEPVGSAKTVKVDVRIISATNRDLKREVEEGNFREDLYYRLNVFPLMVPSLAERGKNDVASLLDFFCGTIAATEGRKITGITNAAKELLCAYEWPGNVRQIENAVYRAVVLCESDMLDVPDFAHILSHMQTAVVGAKSPVPAASRGAMPLPCTVALLNEGGQLKPLNAIEAEIIREALEFYDWHISQVAKRLGIGRSTLYRKMAEYDIKEPAAPRKATAQGGSSN